MATYLLFDGRVLVVLRKCCGRHHDIVNICVTNDHCYVPFDISTSSPLSINITGLVIRLTRRVPFVEQKLLTLPKSLTSPAVLSGIMGFVLLKIKFSV